MQKHPYVNELHLTALVSLEFSCNVGRRERERNGYPDARYYPASGQTRVRSTKTDQVASRNRQIMTAVTAKER